MPSGDEVGKRVKDCDSLDDRGRVGGNWKDVSSTEARAIYNLGTAGLTFSRPNINVDSSLRMEHIGLAADAARQGIVMLKNEMQTLPLSSSTVKKIAIVGPNGNVTDTVIGNYAELEIEVDVHVGHMDGTDVVLVYSKPPVGIKETHVKQVIGFQKVFLKAGES
ncbi:hypothetical protein NE237_029243 [Protea cynaroides]|uniref:Fibronectin type III-like domain-containing protein n=1 Tax=Protea cynaroides TaxID=273540 RepID=A0A9Q0JUK8_9MAGN|nr:hypothetical protein NE237_029243 [Protea cynaroides]